MTLILTLTTPVYVVQVSDRRLTYPDGSVFDDGANKALVVECADAQFSVSYTGLGYLPEDRLPPTSDYAARRVSRLQIGRHRCIRTDEWLAWQFHPLVALDLQGVIASLRTTLSKNITALVAGTQSSPPALGVVLAGFHQGRPFLKMLSNFEGHDGRDLPNPTLDFPIRHEPHRHETKALYAIVGTVGAVDRLLRRRIRRTAKDDPKVVAARFVELIRKAARHPKVGRHIGLDCMGVIIGRNGRCEAQYTPVGSAPITYGPHLVNAVGAFVSVSVRYDDPDR